MVVDGPNNPEKALAALKAAAEAAKALSPRPVPEGHHRCECCQGYGEHDTGKLCARCDGAGYVTTEQAKQPIPCAGRADYKADFDDDSVTPDWNPDTDPDKALAVEPREPTGAVSKAGGASMANAAILKPQRTATAVMEVRASSPPTAENPQPELTDPQKQLEQDRKARGDTKITLYGQRATVYEDAMTKALHQQFDMQLSKILARAHATDLRKALPKLSRTKALQKKRDWLSALIAWGAFNDAMRKALTPILYALIVETGK